MSADADLTLARLKRLPVRLRLVHLAALLRHARAPSNRQADARSGARREGSSAPDNVPGQGRAG